MWTLSIFRCVAVCDGKMLVPRMLISLSLLWIRVCGTGNCETDFFELYCTNTSPSSDVTSMLSIDCTKSHYTINFGLNSTTGGDTIRTSDIIIGAYCSNCNSRDDVTLIYKNGTRGLQHAEDTFESSATLMANSTSCTVIGCYEIDYRRSEPTRDRFDVKNCILPVPPSISVSRRVIIVNDTGDTLNIDIIFTPGIPAAMFTWTYQGQPLVNDSRTTISSSGDLVVEDVQPSDRGVYEVTASNNAGNESIVVNVTVNFVNVNITAEEVGDNVIRVTCSAVAYPSAEVQWSPQPMNITTSNSTGTFEVYATSSFELSRFNCDARQTYTCRVISDFNETSQDITPLEPCVPPYISDVRVVTDNNTLRINVTSTPGDPPAMFTWIRHQGEPLVNDSRITVNSSSGDLVVEDVQPSDRGVYEVTASNNAGNESIAVNVTVDFVNVSITTEEVGDNTIRVTCSAVAYPSAEIQWSPQPMIVSTSSRNSTFEVYATSSFSRSNCDAHQNYTCTGTSIFNETSQDNITFPFAPCAIADNRSPLSTILSIVVTIIIFILIILAVTMCTLSRIFHSSKLDYMKDFIDENAMEFCTQPIKVDLTITAAESLQTIIDNFSHGTIDFNNKESTEGERRSLSNASLSEIQSVKAPSESLLESDSDGDGVDKESLKMGEREAEGSSFQDENQEFESSETSSKSYESSSSQNLDTSLPRNYRESGYILLNHDQITSSTLKLPSSLPKIPQSLMDFEEDETQEDCVHPSIYPKPKGYITLGCEGAINNERPEFKASLCQIDFVSHESDGSRYIAECHALQIQEHGNEDEFLSTPEEESAACSDASSDYIS